MTPTTDGQITAPAIAVLFERYSGLVFRVAFQHVWQKSLAEDVTQDVFVKLLGYRKPFADDAHLTAWLVKVTVNRSRDINRAASNSERPIENYYDLGYTEADIPLLETLHSLPAQQRTILCLHDYEGYSCPEIGRMLDLPTNTVSTRLRRARKQAAIVLQEV